ncbi:probable tRNA N6-adenosine threonylcarbamoyltransferase, mitochondrial [Contarinia nasturtii]|uniref:probable tRNA N6-adenosine threonylcarbamoyltransferase, mitochondrial n=1 Tax=Contarinia nasturtii TaxID=265458 RepID=UPI0012D3CA24|nr:probable tRNA N6-adenosine threonylcarbamoyltransferase, mitochondrial [Contarinia nasturtii]
MLRQLFRKIDTKFNFKQSTRHFSSQLHGSVIEAKRPAIVLGIETSCDDTGCAVVDSTGKIHGECLHSQLQFHNKCGGINPPIAQEFHRLHIEDVVTEALKGANMKVTDVDAIAVTSRPGILMSLLIGLRYAKYLCRTYRKPLIPVHHMEAHALMARLNHQKSIQFPYLCLLASGGHCLLALVKNVNDFHLLGEAQDGSPGECFDKIARSIGLLKLPEYESVSGGRAIELEAYKSTQENRFEFPEPNLKTRDCNFSFSGLKSSGVSMSEKLQRKPGDLVPYHEDFCAAILKAATKHLMRKTQRTIQYCERKGFFGFGASAKPRSLVFSGGVACNDYIYNSLCEMATEFNYTCFRPSKRLCTDNGVMIAWNGVERWLDNDQLYRELDIDSITPTQKEPFKTDLINDVERMDIKCSWVKLPAIASVINNKEIVE